METPETIPFYNGGQNLDSSAHFNYLLNFWYTTKLNKELNYIKRNGLHPTLTFTDSDNANNFKVQDGNEISTHFYTVFRIFLEGMFLNFKIVKMRNAEDWQCTYESEKGYGLDSPIFLRLLFFGASSFSPAPLFKTFTFARTWDAATPKFNLIFKDKNSLYVKDMVSDIASITDMSSHSIDSKLISKTNDLIIKLNAYMTLPAFEKTVKRVGNGKPKPKPAQNIEYRSLVDLYNSIRTSMPTNFDDRTKFSFLLTYARNAGMPTVENTEENFITFNTIRSAA